MVLLGSTFLDCNLVAGPQLLSVRPIDTHKPGNSSLLPPSASVQQADGEHHVQHRKPPPSPYSWISFFLAGSSQKLPLKPLIEDISVVPTDAMPADAAKVESADNANAQAEYVRIPSKKGLKGGRRVSFTPQKARELRRKLKETDSFHDLMYHSAIASRLASRDN